MKRQRGWLLVVLSMLALVVGVPSATAAPATERVSLDTAGGDPNEFSGGPSVSGDGRYAAFFSLASDLVTGDGNGLTDIFVRDRQTGTNERVNVSCLGGDSDAFSFGAPVAISDDGRYVAFLSVATNLVCGGAGSSGIGHIFVRDRLLGTTEVVSVSSGEVEADQGSFAELSISGDGRYVGFTSPASNLVPADTNGQPDAFIRDRLLGVTERVSVASDGSELTEGYQPEVSADGRYVAFQSAGQVHLRDRQLGVTEMASVNDGGMPSATGSGYGVVSADGRFVAFVSHAQNLDPTPNPDPFPVQEVYVRDRVAGTTRRVSMSTAGDPANDTCAQPDISDDGRFVVFESPSTNLAPGTTNGFNDVWVHDRQEGVTTRLSTNLSGADGNDNSFVVNISADGGSAVWTSGASDLVAGDGNGKLDIFIRSTEAATKTVAEQFQDLIALIESMDLQIENGLVAKVEGAAKKYEAGQIDVACNHLDSFIHEVTVQTGNHITPAQAAQLIQAANEIKAAIPCS